MILNPPPNKRGVFLRSGGKKLFAFYFLRRKLVLARQPSPPKNMSNYRYMEENNSKVNATRQTNRLAAPYFEAVIASPLASDENKKAANEGLKIINDFDHLICSGYVSTGYQYDDDAVNRDMQNDTWFDNEAARNGSTAAQEAEAEIAFEIAKRRSGEALDGIFEYFSEEMALEIFAQEHDEYGPIYNQFRTSLGEFVNLGHEALQEEWCNMMDDDR